MSKISAISVNRDATSSVFNKVDVRKQIQSKGSFLCQIAEMQAKLCEELDKSRVSGSDKKLADLKIALQTVISSATSFEEVKAVIAQFDEEFKKNVGTSDFATKACNYIQQLKMSLDGIDKNPAFKNETAKNNFFMSEKTLFLQDGSQITSIQTRDKDFYKNQQSSLESLSTEADLFSALASS
ncbi:MAG TPA: hypothetical protein P5048_00060 [Chlamydiales bacterium]|nr:hypothetical protein [Chlamydiales bacterium]